MRAVPEWIATSDDQAIPPRVRLRIFGSGICKKCTRRLMAGQWDCDHIVALANGGQHRESNLQPLCIDPCHSDKTKADRKMKARSDKGQKKQAGIKSRRRTIPGRRFNGDPIPSRFVS